MFFVYSPVRAHLYCCTLAGVPTVYGAPMSEFSDTCKDAKVSPAACREASRVERLAAHDEFFQPSYPVERHDLLKPLTDEINSLSPSELKDVAKVHERLISRAINPPQNGGVDFDGQGNITGLTFGTAQSHFDVPWQAK
jgi:hypothetical protein